MQPLSALLMVVVVLLVRNKFRKETKDHIHQDLGEDFDLPKGTHFVIDDGFCKDDMFTISFPGFNLIAHNSKFFSKMDDTKRAVVYHEFGHCNRWDMAFFFLAVAVSLFYILQPLIYYIRMDGYYDQNSGMPQAMGVVFALIALSALVVVKHDREHLADFYAMKFVPDIYLAFLRERLVFGDIEEPENRLTAFLTTLWHPSWKKRLEYQSGASTYSGTNIFFRCFLFGLFITVFMIYASLEREAGRVLFPLAICLYIFSVACVIGWTLDGATKLQFWKRLSLSGGHFTGVAAGLIAFFQIEIIMGGDYSYQWQLLTNVLLANFLTLLGVLFMLPFFIRNGANLLWRIFYASAVTVAGWMAAYIVFYVPDVLLPAYNGSENALFAFGAIASFLFVFLFTAIAFALCCVIWLGQHGVNYFKKRVIS
ncbi:M48 family metalloprotease [Novosphingobium beihaiensis]|uniref:M48 family metalloprotease n=1 Tax=Novosphingobium beihaiensis TaxID=2930389 RepID=A0ABT0BS54_9SPHN|nr:M48 family metalloprotease [Novosphingobium beihaiensis]MCJ2187892.1 M48 family metalloprotease [Novosphingobium beihaiensis]